MTLFTTREAARELGCAERTVRKWAQRMGWAKRGRDYLISEGRLSILAASVRPGPGRPPLDGGRAP